MDVDQEYVAEVVCEDVGVQLSGFYGFYGCQDGVELGLKKILVARLSF